MNIAHGDKSCSPVATGGFAAAAAAGLVSADAAGEFAVTGGAGAAVDGAAVVAGAAGGVACCAMSGDANQTVASTASNLRTFLNKIVPRPSSRQDFDQHGQCGRFGFAASTASNTEV
jgi:hypothetical protein